MMLRATSEMAVAMRVASAPEKPRRAASARPSWRAVTTSASALIGMRLSPLSAATSLPPAARQEGEALVEVQRGLHALHGQPELHHGERHVGLDADDHGVRAAQPHRVHDAAEGA